MLSVDKEDIDLWDNCENELATDEWTNERMKQSTRISIKFIESYIDTEFERFFWRSGKLLVCQTLLNTITQLLYTHLPEIVEIVVYGRCLIGHYLPADYLAHDGFGLGFHCYYLSQPVSLLHTIFVVVTNYQSEFPFKKTHNLNPTKGRQEKSQLFYFEKKNGKC